MWRERFFTLWLPGLDREAPPPRRIPKIPKKKIEAVIEFTQYTTAPDATHWGIRSMAKAQVLSKTSIHRMHTPHEAMGKHI